ncbi:pyrroline-5-carboxylate reductase family protein [Acuticoccus sediminis]|uniref:pyrroline-5-carboxylate reductase family protein n=1 Tax=Acuticoccus sediminis TaxID=2184697 RepID=UPI001CFE5D18|nr:pyrroline-5-carboxylate reductase dimerization domain-containing protein [Acuticoccus sediminis]
MTLGIIGVGHLAVAVIEGLIASGMAPGDILLAPRGKGPAMADRFGVRLAADNAAVVAESGIVLLAVRPGAAADAVAGLGWRPGQRLVSACAGVPIEALQRAAPEAEVVRVMPLTAASIGASPTLVFPADPDVVALLERVGSPVPLRREDDFEVATVHAAVYGWAQALIATGAKWSAAQGLDEATARRLAARTFVAAGRMIAEQPAPMDDLIAALATPGGITEAGLRSLEQSGVPAGWEEACDVVLGRLKGS